MAHAAHLEDALAQLVGGCVGGRTHQHPGLGHVWLQLVQCFKGQLAPVKVGGGLLFGRVCK